MRPSIFMIAILLICQATRGRADVIFNLYEGNDDPSSLTSALSGQTGPIDFSISGVTATFSTPDGIMNRSEKGFGVNGSRSGDATFALDGSDALDVMFSTDITITKLDLRNMTTGESLTISIGTKVDETFNPLTTYEIAESDLDDKISDYKENLAWFVEANQTVRFSATASESDNHIAIDAIHVIPEPTTTALLICSAVTTLALHRFFR